MLGIGDKFPEFKLQACVSREKGKEFAEISNANFKKSWAVLFFWPLDFTFVCPTEIAEFNKAYKDFANREAKLFGLSADSHFTHLAWRENHADLKDLQFPMIADYNKTLTNTLGIASKENGAPLRATYIVDPEGIIRWVSVNDLSVGRNVKEVVRTLDALQTDELCPCNWEKGQKTLG
ncbi:MAG TPA: peroxiredoxin [Pseudobdellovibrionaceae bacterium]|jgi:peroxiredoxin (alkyl hydroperoxide reductase subunit C)